jgi:hypothetical protein
LALTVLSGLVLLFMGRFQDVHSAAVYGALLAVLVWNRIDSRGAAYKMTLKGPGGSEVGLESSLGAPGPPVKRDRHTSVVANDDDIFTIVAKDDRRQLVEIKFQKGPVGEVGVNGIFVEDLLDIVVARLNFYQLGAFPDPRNDLAIRELAAARGWLGDRTRDRVKRGVDGTSQA